MVREALVLVQGVQIRSLYKLQGSTVIDRSNNFMVLVSGALNLKVSTEKIMFWHQRLRHIRENVLQIRHGKSMV